MLRLLVLGLGLIASYALGFIFKYRADYVLCAFGQSILFYNDVVLKYNTKIETVPSNIITGMFHFEQEQYFQADEGIPPGAAGAFLTPDVTDRRNHRRC